MAGTRANNRFRLELPKGWKDQSVHFYLGPEDSSVQHTLTLVIDNYVQTTDLAAYAGEQTDPIVQSIPSAELIKSEQIVLANGTPAWETVIKTVPAENQTALEKRVYVMFGSTAYIFMAHFSKKTIKTIGREVYQIISSLVPAD